jgi:hypothetical protein
VWGGAGCGGPDWDAEGLTGYQE